MKKTIITVRFDRMQNNDLKILCYEILRLLDDFDAEQLQLVFLINRFKELMPLVAKLKPTSRKMSQTAIILNLRKRQDAMVAALLLHLKALKRAGFDEQKDDLNQCYDYIRKDCNNFIHESIINRDGILLSIKNRLKTNEPYSNALKSLGVMRYIETMFELKSQIYALKTERAALKRKNALPGKTIVVKEHIIDELRFFIQGVEITAGIHPENDYQYLINTLNYYLTKSRAQMRNLVTRRKTAKAKQEKAVKDQG